MSKIPGVLVFFDSHGLVIGPVKFYHVSDRYFVSNLYTELFGTSSLVY